MNTNRFLNPDDRPFVNIRVHWWLNFLSNRFLNIEGENAVGVSPVGMRVWLNEEGHPRFPNAQKFCRDWQIPESDLEDLPRGRKRGRPPKTAKKGRRRNDLDN